MTAATVSIEPTDLDDVQRCPGKTALYNLATVHGLDPFVKDYWSPTGVYLALTPQTAEQWRAALAAPPFTETPNLHYTTYRTEVFWFGITVRLSYSK